MTKSTVGSRIFNDDHQTDVFEPNTQAPTQAPTTTDSTLPIVSLDSEILEQNSSRSALPPEAIDMVNPAALSIRRDGCLLENQDDYEFRHCTLKRIRIPTHDDNGHPLNLKNFNFQSETKCRVIRCKPQYGG